MLRNLLLTAAIIITLPLMVLAQPVKVITDASITGSVTFHSDTIYNLQGFVYVENGEVLTIEPGTVIKGNHGSGANATALIVARGGQIIANGTANQPIIFTHIDDDVTTIEDFDPASARGQWGGVIILGIAELCGLDSAHIEGIPESESRGWYGMTSAGVTDDDDNSGSLTYVSIRHGGSIIGAANEINGLTMGAVGRGTTINHVEVFYNLDDGFEWFGGTVNTDHLVSAFIGDDAFDYDEGFKGSGQFWFSIHASDDGDHAGEHDGGPSAEGDCAPYATPMISNATYIGGGTLKKFAMEIRDNAGCGYYNSIITEFGDYAMHIERHTGEPTDSRDRLLDNHIKFYNNYWYDFDKGNTPDKMFVRWDEALGASAPKYDDEDTTWNDHLAGWQNYINNPRLAAVSREVESEGLYPVPTIDLGEWVDPSDAVVGYNPSGASIYPNLWSHWDIEEVDYIGAFDPNAKGPENLWIAGWSALETYGVLGDEGGSCCTIPGDVNGLDGGPDIADLVFLVNYMFKSGAVPPCMDTADLNGLDGGPDIADLVYLVNYMFKSGPMVVCGSAS